MPARREEMTATRLAMFGEVWARKDLDGCLEFFAEDAVYHAALGPEPGLTIRGMSAIREAIEAIFNNPRIFPMRPGPCHVFGDRGIAEWSIELLGADGTIVPSRGIDLFEFVGDKIRLKNSFRKVLSQELGSACDNLVWHPVSNALGGRHPGVAGRSHGI